MTPSASLAAFLAEGVEAGLFAGAAAAVAGPDGILAEAYSGSARVEPAGDAAPSGPGTLWDLASLTKPLAGTTLVLGLADGGALALSDEIGRFGDAWRRSRFEGVTLRRLLEHEAGLVGWYPCYARGEGRAAYRRTLADLDPEAPPGQRSLYSCPGYLLLSEAVETAAGGDLSSEFDRRVAAPLGLVGDLTFAPEASRCAGGERDDASERELVSRMGLSWSGFRTGVVTGQANDGNAFRRARGVSLNAGLFGTARAVAEVGRALLVGDPRLLRDATVEEVLKPAGRAAGRPYRLGWQAATAEGSGGPALSAASFGHTGFTGTSLFVDPVAGRVLVLLSNRLHPDARPADLKPFRRRFHEAGLALS